MATEVRETVHDNAPEPIRGSEGASIIGPTNPQREAQNRDRLSPPSTDHGTHPSLKWSNTDSHNRLEEGGAHLHIDKSVLAKVQRQKHPS